MTSESIRIVDGPINVADVLQDFGMPSHGGQSIFIGRVRDSNHGRKVLSMGYDLYAPQVQSNLLEIVQEARTQFGDLTARIAHARGTLSVGDASVVIAMSTPHRAEAFSACRYVIEQLKVRSAIWKKEFYEDGESAWLQGHALCQGHGEESQSTS